MIAIRASTGQYFSTDFGWNTTCASSAETMKFADETVARAFARETFNWRNFSNAEMDAKIAQMEFVET